MIARRITPDELHALKVAELGLDSSALDLTSIEAIAGSLRRAARFLCPCPPATLVHNVVTPMRGLVNDMADTRELVWNTLESMISYGDFLEYQSLDHLVERGTTKLLYAAPHSFVVRDSGTVMLLGISPDDASTLPDELEARIEYINHLRRIFSTPKEGLSSIVRTYGLTEIPYSQWLRSPPQETPSQHLDRLNRNLDSATPARDIPGLLLLEPELSVLYYPGRWKEPRSQSGRYVARRTQLYGADLWCFVEMQDGKPTKFIDLPLRGNTWRGCDEAWHLQMAVDADRDNSQRFRIQEGHRKTMTRIIEFFSPVPMWARRRWDAISEPVPSTGCLFAYKFRDSEVSEEVCFIREMLWHTEL